MAEIKEKRNFSTYNEIKTSKQDYSPEYLEYRRKWNENPENCIVGSFPIHLDIEANSSCNLKCKMCFQSFKPPKPGYMDWDLYTKLIDEGAENGLCSIKLMYRGEPLLHPRIADMVKYAKVKGILEVMFNTNVNLLNEKMARALIDAGMDKIICSIDGYTKDFYESIRIGGNFNTVLKNIVRLNKLKKELNINKPIIRIQMVLLKSIKNIEEHVKKYVEFWGPYTDDIALEEENERDDTKFTDIVIAKDFKCNQPWRRLFIMWDGEYRLCCGDTYGKFKLGNAKETSIKDIWLGPILERVRKLHINGDSHKMRICNECGGRLSIIKNSNIAHKNIKNGLLKQFKENS
ncbi:radical SAM protein [Candidatus Woesearchaeota archaeon]|nr:radical SAM protein [Candidatus Woesearchaeota archaeon]